MQRNLRNGPVWRYPLAFAGAFCLALLISLVPIRATASSHVRSRVLLISIDAFRPDDLGRGFTPTLDALARAGASGRLRPAFPTLTFPNHYALVTGLRPDHNGIVDNTMEDPDLGRFAISDAKATTDRRWWDAADPIWATAERQGRKTGVVFWPGSQAPIRGVTPRLLRAFTPNVDTASRVDTLLGWYGNGDGPDLAILYIDAVDAASHAHGPGSPPLFEAVSQVDREIGRLLRGLADVGVRGLDVVIVSDHGMTATSRDRVLRLDTLGDAAGWRLIAAGASPGLKHGGPIAAIAPTRPGGADVLIGRHDHFTCWPKSRLPARFGYGRNPRVPAVICLADEGWILLDGRGGDDVQKTPLGSHGFDPDAPSSEALFIASGPDIRRGVSIGRVPNVEVHALVARLLRLRAPRGDAEGRLRSILIRAAPTPR